MYFTDFTTDDGGFEGASVDALPNYRDGNFLGPFLATGPFMTRRSFPISDVDYAVIDFNLVEFDGWHKEDTLSLSINGETIEIDNFDNAFVGDSGATTSGIEWDRKPRSSEALGYGSANDQMHEIKVTVPGHTFAGLGALNVKIFFNLGGSSPGVGAIDNFRVTAMDKCFPTAEPSASPVTMAPNTPAPITAAPIPPLASSCSVVAEEIDTFEDGQAPGWANSKLEKNAVLTTFLGRYAKTENGSPPTKTYQLDPNTNSVALEFDFYEIDTWEGTRGGAKDKLEVEINGHNIFIKNYDWKLDDGTTTGEENGMKFSSVAKTGRQEVIGADNTGEQTHAIVIEIPGYIFPDGTLEVKLKATLSGTVDNESAGFDNVHITSLNCQTDAPSPSPAIPVPATDAPVTAAPVTAAPVTVSPPDSIAPCTVETEISNEDFESGVYGWTDSVHTTDPGFGGFMGRFHKDSKPVSKVFDVTSVNELGFVRITFDFLEIDANESNDQLLLTVNGDEMSVGGVHHLRDDSEKTGTSPNGIEWRRYPKTTPQNLGFSTPRDQIHGVEALVPASLIPNGLVSVTIRAVYSAVVQDESAGIDNFVVTAFGGCGSNGGGGVNGDPLIMGLAGQLFKFDGRSGAWYSAVSSNSFQWNMKIQEYNDCPVDANKFVSGVGFTVFKRTLTGGRTPLHKVTVNVVNEFGTSTGCGTGATNCLANGSLELTIDGKKFLYPGDYQFQDGTGRVIAFNTYYECSRKWYDFDITPVEDRHNRRSLRRLSTFPGVFDVVKGLEDTMVDKDVCDQWIAERQERNDLFQQPGEWSTIIVKTDRVALHIEYKQEHHRCDAHTVDVWISSISPELYDEDWEGVIGETKDPSNHGEEKVERSEFLKFPDDESYEVTSPFSTKCKGCVEN